MKSNIPALFLMLFIAMPSTTAGFSIASLPYPFNTWHANAKTYATKQEDIQSYHLTIKIKRKANTIKEQSFTAFDYKTVIAKALRYAQKEQSPGLKAVFKPSIRLVNSWDNYPLGNLLQKALPTNPLERANYWKQVEQKVIDSFYVSPLAQKSPIISVKKILSLGVVPLTLLTCLIVFLLGLVLLHYASRKRL